MKLNGEIMRNLWQNEYTLRAGDFDKYDRLKPSAILDLFQDAACQHAEELGLGFDAMLERGYLWVLVRVKFEICEKLDRYQRVIVKTWPLPPHRLNFKREYCITDQSGEVLIKGSSEWMVIDSNERKLISAPDLYPLESFCTVVMFDEKCSKVRDFDTENPSLSIQTSFSDIDVNGHVNNTKYANFVIDAVSPKASEEIGSFQIDYRKEVMEGAKLQIFHTREENVIVSKGVNENGETAFGCKIEYKG